MTSNVDLDATGQQAATAIVERVDAPDRASRSIDRAGTATATQKTPAKTPVKTPAKAPAKTTPAKLTPVAGLNRVQMTNAKAIVDAGKALGLPKRAWVIALATAMQESNLYNLASTVIPESQRYSNQGSGSDHDSVGLFQQRSTTGWGAVKDLMKPAFAATQFYKALRQVPGWDRLPLTRAAQLVQVSAFPDAYAKHESRATAVANALAR